MLTRYAFFLGMVPTNMHVNCVLGQSTKLAMGARKRKFLIMVISLMPAHVLFENQGRTLGAGHPFPSHLNVVYPVPVVHDRLFPTRFKGTEET